MGPMPGAAASEQLLKAPSSVYRLLVAGRGLGLAIKLAGGGIGLPIPSVQATASANAASEWLAPVPPITDWCMLSLMLKLSASILKSGMSPLFTLVNAIELP